MSPDTRTTKSMSWNPGSLEILEFLELLVDQGTQHDTIEMELFLFCFILGHNWFYSRVTPRSVLKTYFWHYLGDLYENLEIELGWAHKCPIHSVISLAPEMEPFWRGSEFLCHHVIIHLCSSTVHKLDHLYSPSQQFPSSPYTIYHVNVLEQLELLQACA